MTTSALDKLSRNQTNQTSSSASIASQDSGSNLLRFLTPDGRIKLEMPEDPGDVEVLFEDIMYKRNILQSLPPEKQNELLSYSTEKKWTIVQQDLHSEMRKAKFAKFSHASMNSDSTAMASTIPSNASIHSMRQSMDTSAQQGQHQHSITSILPTGNRNNKIGSGGPTIYESKENNVSNSTLSSDKTALPPNHYVKKIMNDNLTKDEMNGLYVTLRTESLDWVDAFLELKGHVALANILTKKIYKSSAEDILSDDFLEKESAFFKCFRVLSMLNGGIYEFLKHPMMMQVFAYGLFSTRLSTRKMATEIFVCILEKPSRQKLEAVLRALDSKFLVKQNLHMMLTVQNFPDHFPNINGHSYIKMIHSWLMALKQTLDGRGRMGSKVGASDDFKLNGGENVIIEYAQWSMVFINILANASDNINQRVLLRSKLENCGMPQILDKISKLDYGKLNTQVEIYENGKLDDYNGMIEKTVVKSEIDLSNPSKLVENLWNACKGTENEKVFISLIQNLFLSSKKLIDDSTDKTKLSKQFKLMDSLVTNISISDSDDEAIINKALQRIYDALQTDELARRAIIESRSLSKQLEEVQAQRDILAEKLNSSQDGLVGRLQKEVLERDRILEKTQRVTRQLQDELEDLKRKNLAEKHEHEAELRKMITLLDSKPSSSIKSNKDHGKLAYGSEHTTGNNPIKQALEEGLLRTKNTLKSDSKKFGMTVQPNGRLKQLRLQMENIENEARQLEMTNFTEYERQMLDPPVDLKQEIDQKVQSHTESSTSIKSKKLEQLRKALEELQLETNDISKYNVEAKVNEMFNKKRLDALERLNDLKTKYEDFGIDLKFEDLLTSPVSKGTNESTSYSSLDPLTYQKKIDDLNRLTSELMQLKETQNSQKVISKDSPESSDSSDSESNSDEPDDNNAANEVRSEYSQRSGTSGTGSFMEMISQKYTTGQKSVQPSSPTYMPNSREKSFLNRLRRTSSSAPFLEELSQRVKTENLDITDSPQDVDSFFTDTQNVNHKDQRKLTDKLDSTLVQEEDEEASNNNETLDGITCKDSASKVNTAGNALESLSIAPPPPAPPLPNTLFFGTTKDVEDTVTKRTNSSAPIPPPMPALLSDSKSSLNASTTPPPPPPPPPQPVAPPFLQTRKESTTSSPVLSDAPSVFDSMPRPQKKLKQLHWEKLDIVDDSVWNVDKAEKFADDLYEKGVLNDLEKAFAAREIKTLASRKKEDAEKITFLSHDVSQQFGINLHMFGTLSVNELVSKILRCESDILQSQSVIEFLSKLEIAEVSINLARNFAPYTTDWDGVKSLEEAKPPEKDPNELQRADQIYLNLMVNLQSYWLSRMRALRTIITFEKEYDELIGKLRKVDKAVSALQNSENLKNVFNVILAVGNFMNDTSKQAQGFKLSTLQRLTFIKDFTNSMTFLNFVERVVRTNYPDFNNFLLELVPVLEVVKISVEQLENDCNAYTKSILNVERSIEIGNLSDSSKFHPEDKVLAKVLPVLPEARKKSDLLEGELKLTLLEFDNLMTIYGEDPGDRFAKISFFKKLADFINEYKKAQQQNLQFEEEERAYERRKKIIQEQQSKTTEKSSVKPEMQKTDEDSDDQSADRRAMMDKLLEQLKNAGPTKNDPSSAKKRALARKKLAEKETNREDFVRNDNNEDESIVYNSDSPVRDSIDTLSASPTPGIELTDKIDIQSPSKSRKIKEEDDRAASLLRELRGSENSNKKLASLDEHKEKLRARRRKLRQTDSSEKLLFMDGGSVDIEDQAEGSIMSSITTADERNFQDQ